MSGAFKLPNNAEAQIHLGFEDPAFCGVPAPLAQRVFFPVFQSSDFAPEETPVEVTNLSALGHKVRSLPGKSITSGAITSQMDADGILPALVSPLLRNDGGTVLGGGAFRHIYGPSQGIDTPFNFSVEQNTGDDLPSIAPGTGTVDFTVTVANNAAAISAVTLMATYSTVWDEGVERHPNPTDSSAFAMGIPPEWLDRADGEQGDLYAKIVGEETDPQGRKLLVMQAVIGRPGPITAVWTIGAGTDTATAPAGTGAALTQVFRRDTHEIDGVLLVVSSVPDDDTIVYTTNHGPGATSVTISREYNTVGFFTVLAARSLDTDFANWNNVTNSLGAFMGDRQKTGSTVRLHFTGRTGVVQPAAGALAGTVTVTTGLKDLVGVATAFLSELFIGGLVITDGGQRNRIATLTSDTVGTVVDDWTATEAGVAATEQEPPTVPLTGTYTTATDLTLVASGGAMLTELSIGSQVRTAGGEVRRIATITDDDTATVTRAFGSTEVAVAATTDYEWRFARARATWTDVIHLSGLMPELLTDIRVFLPDTDLPEEKVEVIETGTWTFTAATAAISGVGNKENIAVVNQGQSTGTFSFTFRNVSTRLRKAVESGSLIRFRLGASTGKLIDTSTEEYQNNWVINGKIVGKPTVIPDPDTNQMTVAGEIVANESDPDFPDPVQLEVVSDRADPTATSVYL